MAVKLGRINVDEMLRSLTAKQFAEWQAYARIEPFTEKLEDWRVALLAKAIFDANQRLIDAIFAVNGAEKHKRPKIVETKLDDFLLVWREEESSKPPAAKKKQTWEEQFAIIEMIMHAHSVPGKNA
jgi:hypothetical protein